MSSLLRSLGELSLRALSAIVVALFPAWSPADVRVPADEGALVVLFVAFLVFALLLSLGVARLVKADRLSAALAAVAILALPIAASVHRGDSGPLLRAAFWLSPLVWLTLATIASRVLVPRYAPTSSALVRRAAFVLPLVLAATFLFVGRGRLASRDAMWRAALASDPGNESVALALAARLRPGSGNDADAVLRACANARPDACRCADAFAARALDRDETADALRSVARAIEQCGPTAQRRGIRAEALATLLPAEATKAADEALAIDAFEPHALYAKAMLEPSPDAQRALAVRAIEHGRGERANMLLGLVLLRADDLDGAAAQYDAVLRQHPNEPRATYNLAFIAQKRGRYREAREGYLQALKLDPKMLDARYNLIMLTHENGFDEEARHHLEMLVAADPRYAGIAPAAQMLARAMAPAPSASGAAPSAPGSSASGSVAKVAPPGPGKH